MKIRAAAIILALLAAVGCSPKLYEVRLDRSPFLDTRPGQKVYIDVKNTSSLQDFPLADDLRSKIKGKGYALVDKPEEADVVLKVNVRYSGLMEEGIKVGKIAGGAVTGGVAGGLAGAAAGGSRSGSAASALGGMLVGAGLGAWLEDRDRKNTFVTVVDFQVTEKPLNNRVQQASIYARVRERGLTMETAAERVRPDITTQIAGLF